MKTSIRLLLMALGAAAFGGGIILANVLSAPSDAAFIEEACGETRWPADAFPVRVVFESRSPWEEEVVAAAAAWNAAAGREILRPDRMDSSAADTALAALSGGPEPAALIAIVSGSAESFRERDARGYERGRWDPRSCQIGYAVVVLPDPPPAAPGERRVIAEHELGHALGLAHDRGERSVMRSRPDPELGVISQADGARFKAR